MKTSRQQCADLHSEKSNVVRCQQFISCIFVNMIKARHLK